MNIEKVQLVKPIDGYKLELTQEEVEVIYLVLGRTIANGTKMGDIAYKLYDMLDNAGINIDTYTYLTGNTKFLEGN